MLHERFDRGSLVPAAQQHLVSPEMDVVVVEGVVDVAEHFGDGLPGEVDGGIELTHVFAIAVQSYGAVFGTSAPRVSMCRGVNLGYDPDSSQPGVSDNRPDVCISESATDFSELAELGGIGDLHGKTVLIDDVPMQDIQLHVEHRV